jgi:hypothetical protein
MAPAAEHRRLAVACCHADDPHGFLTPRILLEVFERPHRMHLHLVGGPTQFTDLGQEPLFKFRATIPERS